MSDTETCDFALTPKFVFFLVRGCEDAYAMFFFDGGRGSKES